ncbi:uncharacterized protein PFL1_01641 [Pseudozyma flocculosa PF-1]|uniref:uncharacterized protein n=1 Tax=Pseudozyma flocculosa PF-1 TaxID=1277687 RepID=UPI000456049C|nr:uncharacterized protein PFL1_01641 [Pseudozyma flocculosa PF-1]EPQ30740.1 hypothetical protein PFL1_01641 [Pseudozyma flocculosa PF-1]
MPNGRTQRRGDGGAARAGRPARCPDPVKQGSRSRAGWRGLARLRLGRHVWAWPGRLGQGQLARKIGPAARSASSVQPWMHRRRDPERICTITTPAAPRPASEARPASRRDAP